MHYRLSMVILSLVPAVAAAEVAPAKELPCFPGAYYRKAVSSQDAWTGIEGVITLPEARFDAQRRRPKNPAQFLDNPSVYMGGRAGEQEIDAGVTWEVVREANGTVSKEREAFRPFWRNKGWFTGPAHPDYYFWPGDTIRVRIETPANNKLTMRIELVERGKTGKREVKWWGPTTRPVEALWVDFDAHGFGPGRVQEFKRVNAIDQVGREGKGVDPTNTTVTGAVWHEVYLLRGAERLEFAPKRFTDMRCPRKEHHSVQTGEKGGERIAIFGSP